MSGLWNWWSQWGDPRSSVSSMAMRDSWPFLAAPSRWARKVKSCAFGVPLTTVKEGLCSGLNPLWNCRFHGDGVGGAW